MNTPERPARGSDGATTVEDRWPVVEEEVAPPPSPPPPRGPLLWPWLLLLLLLVLGGLAAAWYFTRDHGGGGASTVDVPLVVHLRQQAAVNRLNRRGLVARVTTRRSAVEPGRVVDQDPNADANVRRHSVVALAVSAGRAVAVPDVVGRQAAAADEALHAKGFQVRTKRAISRQAAGTVLAQPPQAGAHASPGSTVVIRVARGLVKVPHTVGQTRDSAVAELRKAGLVPRAVTVPSSQPRERVVAQSPRAGKRVRPGAGVRVNISNGSEGAEAPPPPPPQSATNAVTVPDVTGQTQSSAQRQLNAAGLRSTLV